MSSSPLRIIFFGPPGSGKGTQSELLEKDFNLVHISTGDALRAEVAAETPLGLRVKGIMESGNLVDDDTIMEIMAAKMERHKGAPGFIFDGIPRTIVQAQKLDEMLNRINEPVTHVLYLNVDVAELKRRICGRLFHPGSGRVYHKEFHPPAKEMTDDITGEPLIIRKDDTEEVFNQRMEQYNATFQPVFDYFRQKGVLQEIDGTNKKIEDIYAEIRRCLGV